jgi:hypothetical protein
MPLVDQASDEQAKAGGWRVKRQKRQEAANAYAQDTWRLDTR